MKVGTLYDIYLMMEAAAIEGVGVDAKLLKPLFCENELVGARSLSSIKIDDSLLRGAELTRDCLTRSMGKSTPSGDAILGLLRKQKACLLEDHPGARVLIAFWEGTCGEHAEGRLKREVVKCFPSASTLTSKDATISQLDNLKRSSFFTFLGLGARALFSTAYTFVDDLKHDRTPKYDTAKNSDFMKAIMQHSSYWLEHAVQENGSQATKTGKDAASAIYKLVMAKKDKRDLKSSMNEIRDLQVYGWLLTEEQRVNVETCKREGVAEDLEADARVKLANAKPKAKAAGRKKVAVSGRDAVLAML